MYDVDAIEQQILEQMAQSEQEVAEEVTDGNDIDLQFDEDQVMEVEETVDEVEKNEHESVDETTEYVEEDVSEDVTKDNIEVEDTPQHRAFAEMRVQNKQLEEQLQQQQELLEIVRQGSGFQTEEEMYQALINAKPEIEKQSMGLDDAGYQKHKELQEKEFQIQQQQMQVYQEQLDTRATKFQSEIDAMANELGIKEDTIFEKLVNNGHTDMEQILMSQQDYTGLLKSVLIDEIVEARAKEKAEKELSRKSVESDRIDSPRDASSTFEEQQQSLLDKEIEDYKKEQGY